LARFCKSQKLLRKKAKEFQKEGSKIAHIDEGKFVLIKTFKY
jgi:hypothetical protein